MDPGASVDVSEERALFVLDCSLDMNYAKNLCLAQCKSSCACESFLHCFQVFSEANIMFSIGGRYFVGEPITYTYIEDRIFETSRNISIKLHHRIGRFVKLQLHFAAKWIMISEVTFDSGRQCLLLAVCHTLSHFCLTPLLFIPL
jgi:discoidin domain receptor family protein 2